MQSNPEQHALLHRSWPLVALIALSALLSGCSDSTSPNVDSSSDESPGTAYETHFRETMERMRSMEMSDGGMGEEELLHEMQTLETLRGGFDPITGPTVITLPGVYRVVEDFKVSSGDGIVIRANFVWMDLHKNTITGPGSKSGRAIVIEDSRHVFVGKGIVDNFGVGVALEGATLCGVSGIIVQGADEPADPPTIPPQVGFLLINSSHNVLFGDWAQLVNLGYFVRGGDSTGNLLSRNQAVGGEHGLLAVCYNPADREGDRGPHHDLVRRNFLSRFDTGIQLKKGAAENRFVRNVIEYFVEPTDDLNGSNHFIDNETIRLES